MCKSALYAVNSAGQAVLTTGTVIDFGAIIRRFGKNVTLASGNVITNGEGYYNVDVNLTFTPAGTGPVVVEVLKDGVPVPGAIASITTVATNLTPVSIPTLIRNKCCDGRSVITVEISGADAVINNAAIVVKKI